MAQRERVSTGSKHNLWILDSSRTIASVSNLAAALQFLLDLGGSSSERKCSRDSFWESGYGGVSSPTPVALGRKDDELHCLPPH